MSSSRQAVQIRALLIEDVAQVSQFIRGLLDAQAQVKLLDVITDGMTAVEHVRELRPDVVIVDALLRGDMNGLDVTEAIRLAGFDLPILCLTVPQKPVTMGEGMGIARVLTMPFSGYEFINIVKQLHEEHSRVAPERLTRVYAVFGAKGGVGTTTLAYNIGAAIAAAGRQSVALVDGSLQFADLRALLRVEESVASMLQLPTNRLTQADLIEVAWRDNSGMDVFFAPPRPEMAEMVTAQDLTKLIALLRRVYNIVLLDTPTSVGETTLALLDAADRVIVVLAYEASTLRQARAVAGTFSKVGYGDKLVYLLNRSDSRGGLDASAIEEHVGRRADYSVVSDGSLVVAANNRGEPFVLSSPDAQISQELSRIAEHLSAPIPLSGTAGKAAG